jgi:hypothetical protein
LVVSPVFGDEDGIVFQVEGQAMALAHSGKCKVLGDKRKEENQVRERSRWT